MKFKVVFLIAVIAAFSVAAFGQAAPAKDAKSVPAAKLPSAQQIVDRYVEVSGGRQAYEKVKTRTLTGTIDMQPMGLKGTFETLSAAPDRSITKMNLSGIGEMIEAYDGTTAWAVNPIQGSRTKSGAELLQTKYSNDFYRDIRLDKIYPKMEVKGIEKVGGKDAYVVRAEPVGLNPDLLYFDVASGMLIAMDTEVISPEGTQKAKIFYDEYKPFDGVMIPTKMRTVLPQVEMTMVVSEVKSNTQIDPAKFARPKV